MDIHIPPPLHKPLLRMLQTFSKISETITIHPDHAELVFYATNLAKTAFARCAIGRGAFDVFRGVMGAERREEKGSDPIGQKKVKIPTKVELNPCTRRDRAHMRVE